MDSQGFLMFDKEGRGGEELEEGGIMMLAVMVVVMVMMVMVMAQKVGK